jgi:ketosteroid isomerase-like protein
MGVTDPAGPVMDRDEVDRALARLGAEHEAIETSLLALQDHAGRRLLEGAELTGVTKERWQAADASITLLWAYFDAYSDALRSARDIRSRRRWSSREDLVELTELLRGDSVTVAGSATATANAPTLHGGSSKLSERFSLVTLVDRMNELYATSLDMVVAADAVWSALPARIDLLAAELQRTRGLAHSVGVRPGEHPAGDDLERITRTLTDLREQVISDPLAFWVPTPGSSAPGGGKPDTTVYDREARALEDVRREIDAVLTVRQDAEARLVKLRDVLSRADRTLAEARMARGEVLAKIAATEVPVVSGPPTALQEQLAAAAEYRRHAQWHRLSPLLDSLEEKAEDELLRARESLTAVTAPLAVRAELRGRLDAYKAKVARHGLAEDPLLVERYDAARRMLWSAPCDLRVAEQAVLRYQHAVAEVLGAPRGSAQGAPEDRRGESSS